MTKYVITTVELVKRVYLIEAYSKSEAYDKLLEIDPEEAIKVEVLGDHVLHEQIINEYEYKHSPDYNEGHDLLAPQQREMFDESNDIWRDD